MSAQGEERAARTRLRSLDKARKAKARKAAERERQYERDKARYRVWLVRERIAYTAHAAEPQDRALLRAWIKCWAERPALYGRKEAAA